MNKYLVKLWSPNLEIAWPGIGLRSGRKSQKTGSNRKNIGKRSELSGILGRGKGRRTLSHSLADFFFFANADFFSFFPQCGAWSQARDRDRNGTITSFPNLVPRSLTVGDLGTRLVISMVCTLIEHSSRPISERGIAQLL